MASGRVDLTAVCHFMLPGLPPSAPTGVKYLPTHFGRTRVIVLTDKVPVKGDVPSVSYLVRVPKTDESWSEMVLRSGGFNAQKFENWSQLPDNYWVENFTNPVRDKFSPFHN